MTEAVNYSKNFFENTKILIIDGSKKQLKLAKWRLRTDGYSPSYFADWSEGIIFLQKNNPDLVIINAAGYSKKNPEFLRDFYKLGYKGKIIVALADRKEEILTLTKFGREFETICLPLDFQELSIIVKSKLRKDFLRENIKKIAPVKKDFFFNCNIEPEIFFNILELLDSGIMIFDPEGKIIFCNKSFAKMAQLEKKFFLGKKYNDISINKGSFPCGVKFFSLIKQTFESRENQTRKLECPSITGSIKCRVTTQCIEGINNKLAVVIGIMDKIYNNNKDVDNYILQSEKLAMVGQLAAGAVHEIRNPLTSVRGFIQLLKKELEGTTKEEYIEIIINEIDRVNSIMRDFLNLAKPLSPQRTLTSLTALFQEIIMLMESEAFIKKVKLVTDFADNLPMVSVVKEQIKQVILNVIQNAFEAMPDGGILTISVHAVPENKVVRIAIQDTGNGMDKETLSKIFDPFYTTKENGTGLGLPVSLHIIESHGGDLKIDSCLGQGTRATITLPIENDIFDNKEKELP